MNCQKVKRKLSAYQDKELPELQMTEIENHLKTCTVCSQSLQEINDIREILAHVDTIESAPFFWTRLSQRIKGKDTIQSNWKFSFIPRQRVAVPVLTILIFAVALFIGIYLGESIYQHSFLPSSMIVDQELDQALSLTSFDDFPAESVADVYVSLISENNQ